MSTEKPHSLFKDCHLISRPGDGPIFDFDHGGDDRLALVHMDGYLLVPREYIKLEEMDAIQSRAFEAVSKHSDAA